MKILAINGSPRSKGITNLLLEKFLDGAQTAGAEVETIYLAKEKIHHCTGEFHCWLKDQGHCLWDGKDGDTMADIRAKMAENENWVLATPIYVDGMTGLMKNMFDRQIPNALPFMETDEQGDIRHPRRVGAPDHANAKIVLISTCGFPEMATFGPLVNHVERIARNAHTALAGKILRPQGMVLPRLGEEMQSKIYAALSKAGTEFVENGKVSPETEAEIAVEFMPKEMFIKGANIFWGKAIEQKTLDVV
ncbi:MAG: flavodoxin family protein [Deltaproteobacteria bacterium]|nr:flavodoxin family protein [Deltaproteobacteria bacterium]